MQVSLKVLNKILPSTGAIGGESQGSASGRLVRRWLIDAFAADRRSVPGRIVNAYIRLLSSFGRVRSLEFLELLRRPGVEDSLRILARGARDTPFGLPLRLPIPLLATVAVNESCPFGCDVCYSNSKAELADRELSLDVVEKLAESKIPSFVLTGGEPVFAKSICEITAKLIANRKHVMIATNASATSAEPLLSNFGERVCFILTILAQGSIDQSIRGRNVAERLASWSDATRRGRSPLKVNLIVDGSGPPSPESLGLICRLKPQSVYITRHISVGRKLVNRISRVLANDAYEGALIAAEHLRRRGLWDIIINVPHPRPVDELVSDFRSWFTKWSGIHGTGGPCGAGRWVLHVEVDGRVFPCPFTRGIPIADLSICNVAEAWDRMKTGWAPHENPESGCNAEGVSHARLD